MYLQEIVSKTSEKKTYFLLGILKVTNKKEQDPKPDS
jgi:hypothetical protein